MLKIFDGYSSGTTEKHSLYNQEIVRSDDGTSTRGDETNIGRALCVGNQAWLSIVYSQVDEVCALKLSFNPH